MSWWRPMIGCGGWTSWWIGGSCGPRRRRITPLRSGVLRSWFASDFAPHFAPVISPHLGACWAHPGASDERSVQRQRYRPAGSARHRERARIVLAIADGAGTSAASRLVGGSRPTVIKWRERFAAHAVAGLDDQPRSGRPKTIDDAQIIAATLEPPPAALAVTHWSSRLLGRQLGISDATVARAWRAYRVQPWRRETFKFSTDPALEAKVRDVVGL